MRPPISSLPPGLAGHRIAGRRGMTITIRRAAQKQLEAVPARSDKNTIVALPARLPSGGDTSLIRKVRRYD